MRSLALIAVLALTSCASHPTRLAGVSEQEASVIARDYIRQHSALSIGCVGPFDGGSTWFFTTAGDADIPLGVDVPPVYVDKSTGRVTWAAKPPVRK
jgi:hypothetical protein